MHAKPLIALTLGDPAGVGPETIVGSWSDGRVHAVARPFVVGHPAIVERAIALKNLRLRVVPIESPGDALPTPDTIPVLTAISAAAVDVLPATVDARGGQAAYDATVAAARMALAGEIDGLVTAPLHKGALSLAGHKHPGHTELLAELCGVENFAMMLYLAPHAALKAPGGLAIVHVTLHMALRDVFAHLTQQAIVEKTQLVHDISRRLGTAEPRVGVCALNPHAGEDGLFGDEEITTIAPAVMTAKQTGMHVAGPFPADTLIARAAQSEFDAVVAMYHDQGHIAVKLLAMHHAVNITLGLPIVRTSVAHGTAFDKAWRGTAETTGMVAAIETAAKLATTR